MKKLEYKKPDYEIIVLLHDDIILTSPINPGDEEDWDDDSDIDSSPVGLTSGFSGLLDNIKEGFSDIADNLEQNPQENGGVENPPLDEPPLDMNSYENIPPVEETFNQNPVDENFDINSNVDEGSNIQ